ncbi:MAG: N-formylglutamate amidohydrolase [Pseudomonadota bacterium]
MGPVEIVATAERTGALCDVLLICDHARNAVPADVAPLGLSEADMGRHIAFDIGARGVTLALAERLGAGAVLSTFSRLVIDPNRGEDDPTLVMRLADGSIIPGNRSVSREEIQRRIEAYHRPYHQAVDAEIDGILARAGAPALVSIHSFTPQFQGRPWRPWHLGLLWDRDDRLLRPLAASLATEADLVVGENEPYTGQLRGDCLWQHGTNRGLPHILIEIRNDLIANAAAERHWADRLAPHIVGAVAAL